MTAPAIAYGDIAPFLIHTCWIIRGPTGDAGVGRDQWHHVLEDTTPSIVQASCRVEHKVRWMGRTAGVDVVASMRIFFARPAHPTLGVEIGPEDTILLFNPDDVDASEQKQYSIVSRDRFDGWSWQDDVRAHWEIWAA